MAAQEDPNKLETPEGTPSKTADDDTRIFTMPKAYRGGKKGRMREPQPQKQPQAQPKTKPAQITPPAARPPKEKNAGALPPGTPGMPQPKKPLISRPLLIIGLILLLGLGIGGFFAYRTLQAPTEPEPLPPPPPMVEEEPEPLPPPEPPEEEPDEEPADPFPEGVSPGTDSDSDGLTDVEENEIYQTNPQLPDSDGDGFLDGNEVFHRYDPNGGAPGTLLDSGIVAQLEMSVNGSRFMMLYPSVWSLTRPDNALEGSTTVGAPTGETIRITFMEKPPTQSLQAWFNEQDIDLAVFSTTSKNGYPMLMTETELTVYMDGGDFVITLEYDAGGKGFVDYLQTFQMMNNSIVLESIDTAETEEEPTPAETEQ